MITARLHRHAFGGSDGLVLAEQNGLLQILLAAEYKISFDLSFGFFQVGKGQRFILQSVNLFDDGLFDCGQSESGLHLSLKVKERRVNMIVVRSFDRGDGTICFDEALIEARRFACGEQGLDNVQNVGIRVANGGRVIADQQALDRRLFFDNDALLAALWRFDNMVLRDRLTCGDRAEQAFNRSQRIICLEIADDDHRRIARMIPFVVVRLHIGCRRRFQVFQPTDGWPMIGVLTKGRRPHFVL